MLLFGHRWAALRGGGRRRRPDKVLVVVLGSKEDGGGAYRVCEDEVVLDVWSMWQGAHGVRWNLSPEFVLAAGGSG